VFRPNGAAESVALLPLVPITTEGNMDWDRIAKDWTLFNRRIRAKWGKLTEDDLAIIKGCRKPLEGKIRQRYGFSTDHIRKEIDDWARRQHLNSPHRRSPGFFLNKDALSTAHSRSPIVAKRTTP